jgi:hypothetical protein
MCHHPALAQTRLNYADMCLRCDAPGDREKGELATIRKT